jgi:3-dehydroquinate dehydratase/shikimate dehydrogenase
MEQATTSSASATEKALICTSVTATSVASFIEEIKEATATGVDLIELRLDFIQDFDTQKDLQRIMDACTIPYIVTYRPTWEG